MIKQSDEWETPQWLFDILNKEFCFGIDACATEENCKVKKYTEEYSNVGSSGRIKSFYMWDALNKNNWWVDQNVFMNPPYSRPYEFVKMAYSQSQHCTVVCLLKCDPSTKWWGIFWDYKTQKPKPGIEIRYLPKRLKFELNGIPSSSAPFASVIVVMDRRHIKVTNEDN